MSFWETSFLWLEAVIASSAVAAVCAVVGVYTVLRRVVFLPAALSQVSGLGVVLAFALGIAGPSAAALAITLIAALLLGWMPEPRRLSREAAIGVVFIAASALVILIGDRIPQESHEIEDILFGNAVMVESGQMWLALAVATGVLVVHAALFRPFLLASFDPETARAHGVPVRLIDALLFLTMGLAIAVATKTVGAMPVFAFSVLPATAALKALRDVRAIFVGAALVGGISAFLGYYASFTLELPTGACTVAVCALFLVPAFVIGALRRS
jgi:zinc transport system permease protein